MLRSTSKWIPAALLAASLAPSLAASAQAPRPDLAHQIQTLLADPAVSRAHWGIDVTDLAGHPLFAQNEAQYFQPASNAKLYTTTAAMALLGPDRTYTTRIAAHGIYADPTHLKGDLVLIGDGDANLSARTIPYLSPKDRPKKLPGAPEPSPLRHLEQMADTVAATGLKLVDGDVLGDDTLFPWEPYPADWAIDDAVWGYGAPVSALTITDNQLVVTVTPAASAGLTSHHPRRPRRPRLLHPRHRRPHHRSPQERQPRPDGARRRLPRPAHLRGDCPRRPTRH